MPEAPQQSPESIVGRDGGEMILLPAGEYIFVTWGFGCANHWVAAFYLDKYPVTVSRYAQFVQATGWTKPLYWDEVNLVRDGDRPVIGVSWYDAEAYCRWAGKRLPTQEESEKAAMGAEGRYYPWGGAAPDSTRASYNWDGTRTWQGYPTLSTVGSYEGGKSPDGLYDLAGTVWEWTSSGTHNSKVTKGGSWDGPAYHLESTYRMVIDASYQHFYLGFRCAQDVR